MPSETIGLISDTHGLLRPDALDALADTSLIIHAGDVGDDDILDQLRCIAPVVAVRGNMDRDPWSFELPLTTATEFQGLTFYVLHDLKYLDLDPKRSGISAVITGHTHMPAARTENGVRFFNPGSAGPRRQGKPVTLMLLHVEGKEIRPEIVTLEE